MKRWILLGGAMLLAVLAFAFIACSDDKDDNASPTDTPAAVATTPMAEETGTPMAGETPQAAAPVTVTLADMGGSGVTGTATLTASADGASTDVVVTIDGGLTEGTHQNHIHTGTCAAQGPVEQNLTDLEAAADGSVAATSTNIAAALSTFEDGDNYVAAHATDGTVVACGDIPVM